MISDTSYEAYWKERLGGRIESRQAQVLDDLRLNGPATRAELARRTGLRLSCICGRVNELIQRGYVKEHMKVPDPDTLKNVWSVCLTGAAA